MNLSARKLDMPILCLNTMLMLMKYNLKANQIHHLTIRNDEKQVKEEIVRTQHLHRWPRALAMLNTVIPRANLFQNSYPTVIPNNDSYYWHDY